MPPAGFSLGASDLCTYKKKAILERYTIKTALIGLLQRDYPSDCVNRKLRDFSRSFFIYVLTL